MSGAIRLESRLAFLLDHDGAASLSPQVVAFWVAWSRADGVAMPDVAAFRAEVDKPKGVITLLHRIRKTLVSLGWLGAQLSTPPDARPLVLALTLAAADAYARSHAALARQGVDAPLQIRFENALAAALVAASRFDRNLKIVRDADHPDGLRAISVLTDTAPEELAFETAQQSCEAELLAAMQAGASLDDRDKRLQRLRRQRAQGIPHPLAIRLALDDHEQENDGARLMFGLPTQSPSPLRGDDALQAVLQQTYGVETYVFGRDSQDEAAVVDQSGWDELQATLLHFVRDILDALEPGSHDPPLIAPASAPVTKVFVSYSHLDTLGKVDWRREVCTHLKVSAAQGTMVEWTDQEILVGDEWLTAIEQAMAGCNVAILLISKDSLTSNFVTRVEIPELLARRKRDGLTFIPVVIKGCDWPATDWLKSLQAFRNGSELASLPAAQRDIALAELAKLVRTSPQPGR